jgi:hypothetical protein
MWAVLLCLVWFIVSCWATRYASPEDANRGLAKMRRIWRRLVGRPKFDFEAFNKRLEERLADELSNSQIDVQMTRITEKRGIYVYETTAYINNDLYRGVGVSAGKAIDDLLHGLKYGRAYHESNERVVL